MAAPFFDNDPIIDDVCVAVAPVDVFDAALVSSGIRVILLDNTSFEELPDRFVRNRSGMWVLTRRRPAGVPFGAPDSPGARELYTIRVLAKEAGYFDQDRLSFVPDPARPRERRFDVFLQRRPHRVPEPGVTSVAGVLMKDGAPGVFARVRARLPASILPPGAGALRPFETQTDERGAFSLPLRLPTQSTVGVRVTFDFSLGGQSLSRTLDVRAGSLNAFELPIEL